MRVSEIFMSAKTAEFIKQLYPKRDADRMVRKIRRQKKVRFFVTIAVTLIIAIPLFIYDRNESLRPVDSIDRNEYGKGMKTVRLHAITEGGYDKDITVDVNERYYTEDEIAGFSKELDEKLWEQILGKNSDAENVVYDLDLLEHMEGYPFEITWKTDDPAILSSKGVIDEEALLDKDPGDEGIPVELCASLRYGDYREDKYSYVLVRKRPRSYNEYIGEEIGISLSDSDNRSRNDRKQALPQKAGGEHITFYTSAANRGIAVLFAGAVAAALLMAVCDRRIKDEAKMRREQMDVDYPRILNQYALYYMAGMNPRAIWTAICSRYEDSLKQTGGTKRYAYEEMVTTKRLMDEGCNELVAYDGFALRCQSPGYRAFISFVRQTVVKGDGSLGNTLYEEMDKAWEERNNRVKIVASEAETKLLLPMFMELAVVLAIVMVPAFIGLGD